MSPALDAEYKAEANNAEETSIVLKPKEEVDVMKMEVKNRGTGIILKPKQEIVAKSAVQIVNEQNVK